MSEPTFSLTLFGALKAGIEQHCAPSRERSLALTRLEECELWISKAALETDDSPDPDREPSRETTLKKADLCVEIAILMLRGKPASESAIEDQAVALMWLPDQELIDTHARLAPDQEDTAPDPEAHQLARLHGTEEKS